jgi:hypothetical protein
VSTKVTFLGRVIFGINKDCVVRTGGHAGLATNTDRFVKVHNSVRPLEHGCSRAGSYTRGMSALVTPRDLMRSTHLRKYPDIDVLDIGTRNRKRHNILRFARGCAGVATNAASVVDDFGPLNGLSLLAHTVIPKDLCDRLYHDWTDPLRSSQENARSYI